jgi:hypothetical protein
MMLAKGGLLFASMAVGLLPAQSGPVSTGSISTALVTTGIVEVNGQARAYTVRHLPVEAFPDLPEPIAQALASRGCTIPQSYEARGPENVIHGSFERPGSADWAVLCSTEGTVSLLVFFAGAPRKPAVLATSAETARLQPRPGVAELGFNWAIDCASPERVREAQTGSGPQRLRIDHDAVADSVLDRQTLYRYFDHGNWTELVVTH